MKKLIERLVKVNDIESITCDKCGKEYVFDGSCKNIEEIQEFHSIAFTGGYSSVFGDGALIECDLCQRCLYEMIKGIYRTKPYYACEYEGYIE